MSIKERKTKRKIERKFKVGDIVRPFPFGEGIEYTVTGYQNIGATVLGNAESVVCVRIDDNGNTLQSYRDEMLLELVSRK